jgi:basic membrane lipoprotein Med (substrate-binding protein (PBP1-ABC) superfamily)
MTQVIFIAVFAISNILMFRKGFKLGIKKEQQARLRRLNTLKKLINNRADL